MTRTVSRSKFATDIFYRLWDETRSCWFMWQGRSIWGTRATPVAARERLIAEEGRNPDTLTVERVFVGVK
jgi:hypothetical protein